MRRALAATCVAALLAAAAPARAEPPTFWERARTPDLDRVARTLDDVEETMFEADEARLKGSAPPCQPGRARELLLEARGWLEVIDAGHLHDARARYDLGDLLVQLCDDSGAVAELGPTLREFPDDKATTRAWFWYSVALARASRRGEEIAAYRQYLGREVDPAARQNALSNEAEAMMAEGDLPGAIEQYRASIALDPSTGGVLARWGLAVALDRAGDLAGAVDEAKRAIAVDGKPRSHLDDEGVFFVPAYEIEWYRALGNLGRAKLAVDAGERRQLYELAALQYERYAASTLSSDPWLPIAKARAKMCSAAAEPVRGAKGKGAPAVRR